MIASHGSPTQEKKYLAPMLILSSLFLNRVEEASFLIKSSESPKIRYNYTISHINSKLYVETSDRYSIPMRRRDFKKRQGM